jgi:hypothetical protein
MIGRSVNPEEQGSALVIALIFIGVWAVVIMAVLGLAETGFNLAAGTADQRDGAYAADGAVMAAIFSTRTYLEGYGDPVACPPLRFTQTENPGEADEELLDVLVQIECTDAAFEPAWFPYETWNRVSDGDISWLDDPSDDAEDDPCDDAGDGDDPQLVFDCGDIRIRNDSVIGRFGDLNDNGDFDEGEPTEASSYLAGDLVIAAALCPTDAGCSTILETHVRLESDAGDLEYTIVHWEVIR